MEEITDICDSDQRPIKALPIAAASTDSALAVPKVGSAVKKKDLVMRQRLLKRELLVMSSTKERTQAAPQA